MTLLQGLHVSGFNQPRTIHSCLNPQMVESVDVEGQVHSAILYKGLEYPWIWVSVGTLGTSTLRMLLFVVQSLSCVWLFVIPWTVACWTPLSSTVSLSLLKFMSTELVMLSNHLILCFLLLLCLQSFSASGSFPRSQVCKHQWTTVIAMLRTLKW